MDPQTVATVWGIVSLGADEQSKPFKPTEAPTTETPKGTAPRSAPSDTGRQKLHQLTCG
jgi:hypothetical protein